MITSQSISYNYRICEIIFNPNPFPSHLQEMILTHYPDSILSNYINKTKNNFHLLQFIKTVGNCSISSLYTGHNLFLEKIFYYLYESILDTFPNFNPLYTIPTHAFHCRVGDVLDFCLHHSVDDHLNEYIPSSLCSLKCFGDEQPLANINDNVYVMPLSHYDNVKSKHVSLIAGGCFREDQDPSKSLSYLKKIENHFLFLGCSVYSRYNFNPDEDLLFLLNSKYYTSGGGRFGELVYYFRKFLNSLSR
jgi:hypothetical protein